MATVTNYAHPLLLNGMSTLAPSQTPLSYASPPSPIPVPVAPPHRAVVNGSTTTPPPAPPPPSSSQGQATLPVEATSTCTSITGSSPTATIPSFCNPSLHANAADLLPRARDDGLATANVTIATAANKIGCCVECARLFNCVAWRFVPVYVGEPSDRLPGGFDPWGRGSCDVIYYTGDIDPDKGVTADGAADICPNGRVGQLLANVSANVPGPGGKTRRWANVYYNGWNQGGCGAPVDGFQAGLDDGRGDPDTLC